MRHRGDATDGIGAPERITVRAGPDFDPDRRAFHHARAPEIPTRAGPPASGQHKATASTFSPPCTRSARCRPCPKSGSLQQAAKQAAPIELVQVAVGMSTGDLGPFYATLLHPLADPDRALVLAATGVNGTVLPRAPRAILR
jgi:hypothetical protein